LKTIDRLASRESQERLRLVLNCTAAKVDQIGLVSEVNSVNSGEIVEGQQLFPILLQVFHGLRVLVLEPLQRAVESLEPGHCVGGQSLCLLTVQGVQCLLKVVRGD